MPSATPIAPATAGSPPPAVVSAALAALERERAARRAAEALAARLEAEKAEIAEQVRRLEHLNDELRKALFGKKSEKLGEDERQLSFDDLGTAVAEAGGEPAADEQGGEAEARRRRRRAARPGARFPARLERRVEVIEPDGTLCPCGCGEMTKIGEDRSERLDIVPARFLVIETVRPRYACNRCKGGGVVQRRDIDALDVRHPARAQTGQDVALDHLAVLPLRIGLAVVGHVFVEKAPAQFGHGRRLGVPQVTSRQVLAGPGRGDDLCGPGPGGGRRDRPVRPDGDFHNPAAVAVLHDIGLASRRTDPDSEALYLVIPEDMLTVPGFEASTVRLVILAIAHSVSCCLLVTRI